MPAASTARATTSTSHDSRPARCPLSRYEGAGRISCRSGRDGRRPRAPAWPRVGGSDQIAHVDEQSCSLADDEYRILPVDGISEQCRSAAEAEHQKASGTTLRRARSLAIHWTRKRAENSAWPRNPTTSQVSTDLSASFQSGTSALPARTASAAVAGRPGRPVGHHPRSSPRRPWRRAADGTVFAGRPRAMFDQGRRQPRSAPQPQDADHVDQSHPEPVVDAVVRLAGNARPMADGHGYAAAALGAHQRRQETVHVVEVRQREECAPRRSP